MSINSLEFLLKQNMKEETEKFKKESIHPYDSPLILIKSYTTKPNQDDKFSENFSSREIQKCNFRDQTPRN